jgi:hypothetical protein
MHEKQFSYVEFVPYQNLKIVSSQFEVQWAFDIACICTNLWCF